MSKFCCGPIQENACNYLSNSDTIFSPVLNDELNGTDRGICLLVQFSILKSSFV